MEKNFVFIKDLPKVNIVELLNRIFGDYVLKYSWDISSLERDIKENSISVDDSFVMKIDGVEAGLVLLSIKGSRCRIDIMGILKEYRGSGVGYKMMDKVLDICKWHGVKSIVLEVPVLDEKAIHFYTQYGFRVIRNLESLCLRITGVSNNESRVLKSDRKTIKDLAYQCLGIYNRRPNWQREPGNLSQLEYYNFDMFLDRDEKIVGYCIWGERDDVMYIMDFFPVEKNTFSTLMNAILDFAREKYDYILIPAAPIDDPIYTETTDIGFKPVVSQKEMIYKIH